jgi:hypothetical protein
LRRRFRGRTCSARRSRRIGEARSLAILSIRTLPKGGGSKQESKQESREEGKEREIPNGFSRMDCSNAVSGSKDLSGGAARCLICFLL